MCDVSHCVSQLLLYAYMTICVTHWFAPSRLTLWSVSEYILPMICAAIFLVSVDLSWKALCTTGMIRASDGASIKCTNLVSSRVCRQVVVFLVGSCRASSKLGTMAVGNIKHHITQQMNWGEGGVPVEADMVGIFSWRVVPWANMLWFFCHTNWY